MSEQLNEIEKIILKNDARSNEQIIDMLRSQFNDDIPQIIRYLIRKRNDLFNTIEQLEFFHVGKIKVHFDLFEFIAEKEGKLYYYQKIFGLEYKIYKDDKLVNSYHGSYLKESNYDSIKSTKLEMYKTSIGEGSDYLSYLLAEIL